MLRWGFAGCVVSGLFIGTMLGAASLWVVFVWLAFSLLAMGFCYGPLGGNCRRCSSWACAIPACRSPLISAASSAAALALVGAYLVVAGVLSPAGLSLLRSTPR